MTEEHGQEQYYYGGHLRTNKKTQRLESLTVPKAPTVEQL
jgi:hypothetical protein